MFYLKSICTVYNKRENILQEYKKEFKKGRIWGKKERICGKNAEKREIDRKINCGIRERRKNKKQEKEEER